MLFLLKALVAVVLVAIIVVPVVWGIAFIVGVPLYIIGDLLGLFRDDEYEDALEVVLHLEREVR